MKKLSMAESLSLSCKIIAGLKRLPEKRRLVLAEELLARLEAEELGNRHYHHPIDLNGTFRWCRCGAISITHPAVQPGWMKPQPMANRGRFTPGQGGLR
jgi:hypothetical protein